MPENLIEKLTNIHIENTYGQEYKLKGTGNFDAAKATLGLTKDYINTIRKEGENSPDVGLFLSYNAEHSKNCKFLAKGLIENDEESLSKIFGFAQQYISVIHKYGVNAEETKSFLEYSLNEDEKLEEPLFFIFNAFRISKINVDSKLKLLETTVRKIKKEEGIEGVARWWAESWTLGQGDENLENRARIMFQSMAGEITEEEALRELGETEWEYGEGERKSELFCKYIDLVNSEKLGEATKLKYSLSEGDEDIKELMDFYDNLRWSYLTRDESNEED
ncbi:MAG: hypothetical protein KKC19_02615 [Nanoarchaeota archaeon]|nr:hypothetical protein [Nanoarchaeota archaeon]